MKLIQCDWAWIRIKLLKQTEPVTQRLSSLTSANKVRANCSLIFLWSAASVLLFKVCVGTSWVWLFAENCSSGGLHWPAKSLQPSHEKKWRKVVQTSATPLLAFLDPAREKMSGSHHTHQLPPPHRPSPHSNTTDCDLNCSGCKRHNL